MGINEKIKFATVVKNNLNNSGIARNVVMILEIKFNVQLKLTTILFIIDAINQTKYT